MCDKFAQAPMPHPQINNTREKLDSSPKKAREQKNSKLAKSEAYIAVSGNILLGGIKLWIATISGSIAVLADAWETLSDSLSSIILIIGLKIAEKPADEEHPFGHGRAELIAAVVIALMLAGMGFTFVKGGIERIISRENIEFGKLAITAMIATIVFKEAMARYAFWIAKKTKLTSLKADAYHHRSDALSSLILLAGMISTKFFGDTLWWMDGLLGGIIGIVLLRLAYVTLKSATTKLLGIKIPEPIQQQIVKICKNCTKSDKIDLHHIHYHEYGYHAEVTFHIRLPGETRLDTAHALSDKIELQIKNELGLQATVHFEPQKE